MSNPNILVEWDDRYSVGIPFIDDQHKELIHLTNELFQGCLKGDETARSYFRKTIKGVVDYVGKHFSAEEKMLENVNYPELAEHKKQHEEFVKKVLEDVKSFQDGRKFDPNVLVRYLKDWILSHIAMSDRSYAEYIVSLKKQGLLLVTPASLEEQNGRA
jgi:hemerythrin